MTQQKPSDWWRPAPVNRDVARDAIEAADAEILDLRESLELSAEIIRVLAAVVPERPADVASEDLVLGWLLGGHARSRDVETLCAYDLSSRARRWVFGLAVSAVEAHERGESMPAWPVQRVVRRAAIEHAPEDLIAEVLAGVDQALSTRPGEAPLVAVGVVAALGRRWSVVDDALRGAA